MHKRKPLVCEKTRRVGIESNRNHNNNNKYPSKDEPYPNRIERTTDISVADMHIYTYICTCKACSRATAATELCRERTSEESERVSE